MYQKVENRALFKKSSAARDKLMELGGVSPQAGGLQSMAPPPPMPQKPMGIMASSPDLMQAAMRKAPVLPTQQGMAPPAPMPQAPPAPLPASQPMPNIAGIAPVPTNPAPRPPLKPGVKKFADGKEVRTMSDVMVPGLATAFQTAFEFGQKAITSENPEDLGVPQENAQEVRATLKKIEEDPKAMGEEVVNSTLTSEEKTKDLKTNLKKVAEKSGISDVPVSATVDQLNTAIAGAKLGAAIAGNYVNPNTGEQLRPTAGARIGQAVAEGLAVKRDTAEKREAAEQDMKLQRLVNAGKSTKAGKGFLETSTGKSMLKFVEGAAGKDTFTEAQINDLLTRAYGADAVTAYRTALGSQAAAINTPSSGGTPAPTQTVDPVETGDTGDTAVPDFSPTYNLKDGTPVMKLNGKWVDAEGNDRSNG